MLSVGARRVFWVLLAASLSVAFGCGGPTAPSSPPVPVIGNRTLTFTVYGKDAFSTPYLLASGFGAIRVNGFEALTDANGVARLSGLVDGPATLTVAAAGWFAMGTYNVTISGDTVGNNSTSPLYMKDDLVFLGAAVDGVGPIESGATVTAPASIHFRVQVSSPAANPFLQATIYAPFGSSHWYYSWNPNPFAATLIGSAELGTKIYDLWFGSYYPCSLNLPTGPVTTPACVPMTDSLGFFVTPSTSSYVDVSVFPSFVINWLLPTPPPRALVNLSITGVGSLTVGQTSQSTLTATFSDGSIGDVTNSATWQSTNSSVASVTSGGLVTALKPGSVSISGTYQQSTPYFNLTVIAPPGGCL